MCRPNFGNAMPLTLGFNLQLHCKISGRSLPLEQVLCTQIGVYISCHQLQILHQFVCVCDDCVVSVSLSLLCVSFFSCENVSKLSPKFLPSKLQPAHRPIKLWFFYLFIQILKVSQTAPPICFCFLEFACRALCVV